MGKYRSAKVSLRSFTKNKEFNNVKPVIEQVVLNVQSLTTEVYQFIKLYFLYSYENKQFNNITNFIKKTTGGDLSSDKNLRHCFTILGYNKNNQGAKPQVDKNIKNFYNNVYSKEIRSKPVYNISNLSVVCYHEAHKIQTAILNNIKLQYYKRLIKLVRLVFDLDSKTSYKAHTIVKDMLQLTEKEKAADEYQKWIIKYRSLYKPKYSTEVKDFFKKEKVFEKKLTNLKIKEKKLTEKEIIKKYKLSKPRHPYYNDLDKKAMEYQIATITIGKEIEKYENKKGIRVVPCRTSFIPKTVTLDTDSLYRIFIGGDQNKVNVRKKLCVWKKLFKMNKYSTINSSQRKKAMVSYTFDYYFTTDGKTVNLLYRKNYTKQKPEDIELTVSFDGGTNQPFCEEVIEEFKYLDDLEDEKKQEILKKRIGFIDPGINNILTMTSYETYELYKNETEKAKKLVYTKMQRRFETGRKTANKKRKALVNLDIGTIRALRKLSTEKVVTSSYDTLKKYIIERQKSETYLYKFYSNEIFRKMRFDVYIKTQASERKLVKNVKEILGEEGVIVFGNWERRRGFKYSSPTPGIRLKRLFLKNEIEVYLQDEYKTSAVCRCCHKEVCKFMYRKNPKPYKTNYDKKQEEKQGKGKVHQVHGLLRCKNVSCNKFWNRDVMASLNMMDNGYKILRNEKLDEALSRKATNQGSSTTVGEILLTIAPSV